MTNPFESMYANWLKTMTGTDAATQWQKAMADCWQMPAAYWQTVGTIMGTRAQTIQQAWQKCPQQMQELATCKTWPEFVGKWCAITGQNICDLTNLSLTTDAYRAGLWKEWCTLMERNQPKSGSSSTQPQQPQPKPQATAQQTGPKTSAYVQQPGTFIPAAQSQQPVKPFLNPKPLPEYQPKENLGQRQPIFANTPLRPLIQPKPVVAQKSEPQTEMPLLTGTHGNTHSTVSPTANSVMRSSGGSTIASTAARRSVVARRQSRRRTPR